VIVAHRTGNGLRTSWTQIHPPAPFLSIQPGGLCSLGGLLTVIGQCGALGQPGVAGLG
jgi:hypothetical protein